MKPLLLQGTYALLSRDGEGTSDSEEEEIATDVINTIKKRLVSASSGDGEESFVTVN